MMVDLNYEEEIKSTGDEVWEVLLGAETYTQWVKAFSANSQMKGEWKQGTDVIFFDPDMGGGTVATIEILDRPREILARHIGMVDGQLNNNSDHEMAQKWIGSTERYLLSSSEDDSITQLRIEIRTDESFRDMFDTCWPKALELIKGLCEET